MTGRRNHVCDGSLTRGCAPAPHGSSPAMTGVLLPDHRRRCAWLARSPGRVFVCAPSTRRPAAGPACTVRLGRSCTWAPPAPTLWHAPAPPLSPPRPVDLPRPAPPHKWPSPPRTRTHPLSLSTSGTAPPRPVPQRVFCLVSYCLLVHPRRSQRQQTTCPPYFLAAYTRVRLEVAGARPSASHLITSTYGAPPPSVGRTTARPTNARPTTARPNTARHNTARQVEAWPRRSICLIYHYTAVALPGIPDFFGDVFIRASLFGYR